MHTASSQSVRSVPSPKSAKAAWRKPEAKDIPFFCEVSQYASAQPSSVSKS